MRRHRRNPVAKPTVFALLLMLAALLPHQRGAVAEEASHPLQLEVYINDSPTKLIGSFTQFADGKMAAKRSELKELGLKVPGEGAADELVVIDQFPDMAYRYDVPTQKIYF